jgi:hypothetical protein
LLVAVVVQQMQTWEAAVEAAVCLLEALAELQEHLIQ